MSDHSISIVPKVSAYPDKAKKAQEILDWLIAIDLVKPGLSDCVVSSNQGYAFSDGAAAVTSQPEFLQASDGFEIIAQRQIFHAGQNGIEELICPKCQQDIAGEAWDFLDAWDDNKSNDLTCPLCNVATEIHQFKFTPEWGFSDLGFTFWNFPPFTAAFVEDFKKKLACDVNIVYTWI